MHSVIPLTFPNEGIPSLRISTASACNHRCVFCQVDGDFASDHGRVQGDDLQFYKQAASRFFSLGVRHFTLTGGEPLLNPHITFLVAEHIRNLLKTLPADQLENGYLRINTNGTMISRYVEKLATYFDLVKVSLHTLREETYAAITKSPSPKRDFEAVLQGLNDLERRGVPVRLQSVIGRWNLAEVSELVSFCEQNRAIRELKLFDISEYSELWHGETPGAQLWRDCYVSLAGIERDFAAKYRFVGTAHSVGGYGNPMPVYETPKGLRVRFRRTDAGAFWGPACKQCPARSFCGDGHCNLEIGPNRLIKVCRPKEGIVFQPGQEAEAIAYFRETRFEQGGHRTAPPIGFSADCHGNSRKPHGQRGAAHVIAPPRR